ncbi:MAG TPA: hypothetical protein VJU82_05755 [Acidobacteriaceae bacterium]|nr:hypothetical protein [Acidobacteriaceae bacterium]
MSLEPISLPPPLDVTPFTDYLVRRPESSAHHDDLPVLFFILRRELPPCPAMLSAPTDVVVQQLLVQPESPRPDGVADIVPVNLLKPERTL